MSTQGNVAELVDGQTHHAWMWNEKNMLYLANKSGVDVASGTVVVRHGTIGSALDITTTEGATNVAGVVPQQDDVNGVAADHTIANDASGMVQFAGAISRVLVTGPVSVGAYLITSSDAGRAQGASIYQPGVFGVATSAAGPGAGAVSAILFPAQLGVADHVQLLNKGTATHADLDAMMATLRAGMVTRQSEQTRNLAAWGDINGMSLTITTTAQVRVTYSTFANCSNPGGAGTRGEFRLVRDATVLATWAMNQAYETVVLAALDSPAPGTHTFKAQFHVATDTYTVKDCVGGAGLSVLQVWG